MNVKGKNILVVGGSSGIGLSLVNFLQEQAAEVYVLSRSAAESWPAGIHHLPGDVTGTLEDLEPLLPAELHGLVYAVGSITLKPFNRLTEMDFLNDYQLNVMGAVRTIQLSLKALKKTASPSIVLISSVAAQTGMPYHSSIAAAKAAVEGLGRSLAAEFAAQHIRVNVVAPSLTNTPMAERLLGTPEKLEVSGKRHPLGRVGEAQDISQLIAFLLADESSWITGQVIGVDGGLGKLKI
jgi:3-oxoacyl-[acyl-carrier protein] reductase